MKKAIIPILLVVLIVMAIPTFVACDEQDDTVTTTVTVTVHHRDYPTITIEKHKGDTITYDEYMKLVSPYAGLAYTRALYLNEQCTIKYDETTKLDKDITLYIKSRGFGVPDITGYTVIYFYFEGNNYALVKKLTEPMTSADFADSEYNKPIDTSTLKYYRDEEMTDELVIDGKMLEELFPDHPFEEAPVEIYVKQVE